MKPIRIFATPSHATKERTSGVDFARVIQPMKYLGQEKGFKVTIYDPKRDEKVNWLDVTRENDIIFLNYTANAYFFAIMGCMARKNKRKIVLDVDDNLWDIREDNTAYQVFKKGSEGIKNFTAICNEVDYITTTSSYLKNVICNYTMKRHDQVFTFPNCIDLSLYTHRSKPKNENDITICHYGSASHFLDLQESGFIGGINKLFKELPNVNLLTIGSLIPALKNKWGMRYNHSYGDVDIYKWIKEKFPLFMDKADIVVAPLEIDTYNRSKSFIKWLEYSSAMKPGVYQDITPYQEVVRNGENGFLAYREEDWYHYLKELALNFSLRKKIGEQAFKDVQKHTIQKNIHLYASFFKAIMLK